MYSSAFPPVSKSAGRVVSIHRKTTGYSTNKFSSMVVKISFHGDFSIFWGTVGCLHPHFRSFKTQLAQDSSRRNFGSLPTFKMTPSVFDGKSSKFWRFFGNRRGGRQIWGCAWGEYPTHTPKSGTYHGKSQRAILEKQNHLLRLGVIHFTL